MPEIEVGWGRKVRRARNVVKTFRAAYDRGDTKLPDGRPADWVRKYERSVAVILADKLRAS
jgi:hypothetical protein